MTGYQIPRNSLAWLLAAQAAVIAPHVLRLPLFVVAVAAACIAWRVMIFQGRWNYPGRWVKVLLVLGGSISVPASYRTMLGLEPAVALLVVAYVLKLLEMHHKRDAYIVVVLGYFVAMTQFLFFQTIPWSIYMFTAVIMITAGLIGLNQTRTHTRPFLTAKTAALLMAQSLPLMIVLFLLFPRLPPLWTVPMPNQVARSGVSDTMSPGDIASLAASSDLAFKVTFEGDPPPFSQLYWRGLVLSEFNGRVWTQNQNIAFSRAWQNVDKVPPWAADIDRRGAEYRYDVILEPTQQNWLFALNVPLLPNDNDIVMARDFRLGYKEPIRTKVRYEVISHLDYRVNAGEMSELAHEYYTDIDNNGQSRENNPRARTLARELRAAATDDWDYVRTVLRRYNTEQFTYTLRPAVLGEHSIDEFMFDTRRGFCEHFAGSFVFMMRAAGIPARVVVGYHGGEYNQFADYVSVYQFDAHAWAEVWTEQDGWRRVDPVTAVAPDRIERGLEAAVEEEASFLEGSPLSAFSRQALWLADLRLQLIAVGYYWDTWVVGYTPALQTELLGEFLGDFDRKELGMLMLGTFFGLLGLIGIVILLKRPHRKLAPSDRDFLRFCNMLASQGLGRHVGEGPTDYAARVSSERPDLKEPVYAVTNAYVDVTYAVNDEAIDGKRLTKAVRAFRLKTLT